MSESIARRLSQTQKDFLFDHIDACRPVTHNRADDATRASMLAKKLIVFDMSEAIVGRPRGTVLTALGREVVCCALAEAAEALVRAGVLAEKPTIRPFRLPNRWASYGLLGKQS